MATVHVLACGVLATDIRALVARLGLDVQLQFLPGGLHSSPGVLRRRLQEAVDTASADPGCTRIAVGYGVCGLGTVGLHARRVPLVLPRVHDCVALFMGSDEAYREQFARCPGTYYVSAGWVDERTQPESAQKEAAREDPTDVDFDELVRKYGQENSDAIRHFLNSWQRNYERAVFIDTGAAPQAERYARMAEAMAAEFGWRYEKLAGSADLISALLTAERASDEILVVAPHHVTTYDPLRRGLSAAPVWAASDPDEGMGRGPRVLEAGAGPDAGRSATGVRWGLGIDAGGTYTDVVLYDFQQDRVAAKAKALTTKWDLSVGIDEALSLIEGVDWCAIEQVSMSTTLATNAIVEGVGQKVGLLIMPPYGRLAPSNFTHTPLAVIDGQLEIDGRELVPVDPEQVRRVARDMVERQEVRAFAVAGYASHCNPEHELRVRSIVRDETSRSVTCGHDISDGLNYRIRAETAALNARIIPCLESLLGKVQGVLAERGITAPAMVVKSDGSLVSLQAALEKPVETILSGPAASVAGARHLARLDGTGVGPANVLIVDMGGTTTDTAIVRDGVVKTCEDGACVGGWKTHVRALDMRTCGLGGDSLVVVEKGVLQVGPRRVAPVAWLTAQHADAWKAVNWLTARSDERGAASTRELEFVTLTRRGAGEDANEREQRVIEALSERPMSVRELTERVGCVGWRFLPLAELEARHVIQRCGFTPTDALNVLGRASLWDTKASGVLCGLLAAAAGEAPEPFADRVFKEVVRTLASELLKKRLDEDTDTSGLETDPAAVYLLRRALEDEPGEGVDVRVTLKYPIIGMGAPAALFLPEAAARLHTEAIIPEHADVANAVGAVTSLVFVRKRVRISVDETGRYSVGGLAGTPVFSDFEEAHRFAVVELKRMVRGAAAWAGTDEDRVEIVADDQVAAAADGTRLFLGRTIEARVTGRPDHRG